MVLLCSGVVKATEKTLCSMVLLLVVMILVEEGAT